jgi:hypothetical protein
MIENDHYGAKLLNDNDVLEAMTVFGHKITYDANEGFMILFRERNDVPRATQCKLDSILHVRGSCRTCACDINTSFRNCRLTWLVVDQVEPVQRHRNQTNQMMS